MYNVYLKTLTAILLFQINSSTAQTKSKKKYCNPLVMGAPTTKRLSLVAEGLPKFNFTNNTTDALQNNQNYRLTYSKTLVTKPQLYVSFTAAYWFNNFGMPNTPSTNFGKLIANDNFHSLSVSSNIFKPINEKNFWLFNVSVEANANDKSLKKLGTRNVVAGGAILYGWKKGFKKMYGFGVIRSYRFGKVIHLPGLLYHEQFNKKWGLEMLLPSRINLRYSPNNKNIFLFGAELDGTQYALNGASTATNGTFLQRGEIRSRIGFESKVSKSVIFSSNIGYQVNGRFDFSKDYLGNNILSSYKNFSGLFLNAGLHIYNFKKAKKKK
jgi:hypothetical protein